MNMAMMEESRYKSSASEAKSIKYKERNILVSVNIQKHISRPTSVITSRSTDGGKCLIWTYTAHVADAAYETTL